jgi:hypothetical protein
VDLQTHTTASDGTCTPARVVQRAAGRGIRVVGITDHDTVRGVAEAAAAGGSLGVEVVPGIELSTRDEPEKDFMELHLLGYFIDPGDPALTETLARVLQGRLTQKRRQIARLQSFGFDLPEAEVFALTDGAPSRSHIADVLMKRNPRRAPDRQRLFDQYLSVGGKAYVPRPFELSLAKAIQAVLAAGGVPVLSHPADYPHVRDPVGVVRRAVDLGLRGIEVNYTYDKNRRHRGFSKTELLAIVRRYDALADELGLLKTGGSDFHGRRKPIELGEMGMAYPDYLRFKEAARC